MLALLRFFLAVIALPFKLRRRLQAVNAALRHQLIILRRKVPRRVLLTNGDRLVTGPAVPLISVDFASPYDHPSRYVGPLASGWLSQILASEVCLTGRAAPD
jgi:hypothetical protein